MSDHAHFRAGRFVMCEVGEPMVRVILIDRNGATVDIRSDDDPLAGVCGRAAALAEARRLADADTA